MTVKPVGRTRRKATPERPLIIIAPAAKGLPQSNFVLPDEVKPLAPLPRKGKRLCLMDLYDLEEHQGETAFNQY